MVGRLYEGLGLYPISRKLFYQDNMSAIQIEKTGSVSSGERSSHINIILFFIKDILKREGIEVNHCPTERMIAGLFTKSMQGKLFRFLRDIVMGLAPFPMEECVGLYEISTKKSIVEECVSNPVKGQPVVNNKEISWANIVKKGKRVDEVV